MRKFSGIEVEDRGYPQKEIQEASLKVQAAIVREMLQEAVHRYDSFRRIVLPNSYSSDEEWYRQARTVIVSTDNLLSKEETNERN